MEATGIYHLGILNKLTKEGYFVHLANPLLIKKYFDAVMRKGKTDKKDAIKLSFYGVEKWFRLDGYCEQDKVREDLKFLNRQYSQFITKERKQKFSLKIRWKLVFLVWIIFLNITIMN